MIKAPFSAFTLKAPGILNQLLVESRVSAATVEGAPRNLVELAEAAYKTSALWDTGATKSVITQSTARALALVPRGVSRVSHAGGTSDSATYLVDIWLPNKVVVPSLMVTECPDVVGDFGVIVGMDIIGGGDLSITNVAGKTVMSFRTPATEHMDFVEVSNRIVREQTLKFELKNGRCSCGSGRLYKNCHGKGLPNTAQQ